LPEWHASQGRHEEGTDSIQPGRQPEKQVSRALQRGTWDTQPQEVKATLLMTNTRKTIIN